MTIHEITRNHEGLAVRVFVRVSSCDFVDRSPSALESGIESPRGGKPALRDFVFSCCFVM